MTVSGISHQIVSHWGISILDGKALWSEILFKKTQIS